VHKLYWAVVRGGAGLPDSGTVSAPVPAGEGRGLGDAAGPAPELGPGSRPTAAAPRTAERPAVTRFSVRARGPGGLAWLELEPVTGALPCS